MVNSLSLSLSNDAYAEAAVVRLFLLALPKKILGALVLTPREVLENWRDLHVLGDPYR